MRRFFIVFLIAVVTMILVFCGCSSQQIDRNSELEQVMDTCDSKWSQAFPDGTASFRQTADFIAGWGESAGLEVTKKADHYLVLTNPATKGMKKKPSITYAISVDPSDLRDSFSHLSLAMTSALGPIEHSRIRLIVTEGSDAYYPGAESIKEKYLKCDHFIYLYRGGSATVYTAGPLSATGKLSNEAARTSADYTNAFRISLHIPEDLDPYCFDRKQSLPNPINVIGDLLASSKSSGRLFEIASFTAKENGDFLPCDAKAVVVIDDNNVEGFQKRFDASYEAFEKRFSELESEEDESEEPPYSFTYTMEPVKVPKKVLRQTASDNIISLMYTLQTGIHLQDEESGSITAASYIRSISTKKGHFSLVMDMRSRDSDSMEEMSGNYLITSGLCDVDYSSSEPYRLWTAGKDSSLAAWFTASVNKEESDPIYMQSSECDVLYASADRNLDMISYRYDKDHRTDALDNLLAYCASFTNQE